MVRGGKPSFKRNFKQRVRSKDKGSDESDEDYVVSDEGNEVSDGWDEDYCSSLEGNASEESYGRFVEEEEEEEDEEDEDEVRKVVRSKVGSKARKGNSGRRDIRGKVSRKRRRVSDDEEEDEDIGGNVSRKRRRVRYDVDEDEDYEDDDEEFTPDEYDCSDEEEELVGRKKRNNMKVGKQSLRKNGPGRGQKRRRKTTVSKKPLRKTRKKSNSGLRRKVKCDDDDDDDDDDVEFVEERLVVREKSKNKSGRRKRRLVAHSDSESSGSSDVDFTIYEEEKRTISEEEREQVREAREFCKSLRTSLRGSAFPNGIQEDGDLHQQRKPLGRRGKEKLEETLGSRGKEKSEEPPGRKGKEKVEEVKTEVGKQVCGICLSEEDKRRVRGTLECCAHYFCFACIMEWAKVESRCPLCKQRFKTISKPARSTAGIDLREVVIPVPERDQVYQPSEEEIRSYVDPYEYVLCTECHEGGDDGLMLLCDFCDSPAHTYCVGLGREVPEGNWYCDGCRPVALAASSSQAQDHLPDHRTRGNNFSNRSPPIVNIREGLDLNSISSPSTPLTQGFVNLSSPRFPVGSSQAASPVSGAGAPTLSGRRWIHRQIQQLISLNRMSSMAARADGIAAANSSTNFLNSQINLSRDTTVQQTMTQDMSMPYHTFLEERLRDSPSPSLQNRDFFSSRLSFVRRQAAQDSTTTSTDRPFNETLWPEPVGMNSVPGYEQLHQCSSRPNIGSNGSVSPYSVREGSEFHMAKEQLQSMVKSHLKNLARDVDLGNNTFTDIARSSTHTILAACGLEHRSSEVYYPVPPPSVCPHIELRTGGQTSLMKGCCSSCFDSFVVDIVKRVMDTKMPSWLSLGL